ncbi:MAG: hypothetical protein ACE5IR_13885, partial [bacterium]
MTLSKITKINILCFVSLLIVNLSFADEEDSKTYVVLDTIQVIGERYLKIPEINTVAIKMPITLHN